MFYTLYKDSDGTIFNVDERLARSRDKAYRKALDHYRTTRGSRDLDAQYRIVQRYGRTPKWETLNETYQEAKQKDSRASRFFFGWWENGIGDTIDATREKLGLNQTSGGGSPTAPSGDAEPAVTEAALTASVDTALAKVLPDIAKAAGTEAAELLKPIVTQVQEHLDEIEAAKPRQIHVTCPAGATNLQGLVHTKFEDVLERVSWGCPAVLLPGPAGCGKTYMAAQVAEALKLEYSTVNMGEGVTETQLFGQRTLEPDGSTGWVDGIVTRAFEEGHLLFLDEFDNADPNTMVAINQILDGSKVVSIAARVHEPMAKRHPDFKVICGSNTMLQGASRMYSSRNTMDGASRDRFMGAIVPMTYDPAIERALITEKPALDVLWAFRKFITEEGHDENYTASTRFGLNLQRAAINGKDVDFLVNECTVAMDDLLRPVATAYLNKEVK